MLSVQMQGPNFVMVFISLCRDSEMLKMAKHSFWHPSLKDSDLTYSQIAVVKSITWSCFVGITSSSGGKLALRNAHFNHKILFLGEIYPNSQASSLASVYGSYYIWYGYNWNMWGCSSRVHFASAIYDTKWGSLKLKKILFLLFFVALPCSKGSQHCLSYSGSF